MIKCIEEDTVSFKALVTSCQSNSLFLICFKIVFNHCLVSLRLSMCFTGVILYFSVLFPLIAILSPSSSPEIFYFLSLHFLLYRFLSISVRCDKCNVINNRYEHILIFFHWKKYNKLTSPPIGIMSNIICHGVQKITKMEVVIIIIWVAIICIKR